MLTGKKILIGISGSIAAYKSILIIRLLIKAGAEVKVVMTPAAKDFVSPLVLSTLSKNDVLCELTNNDSWANHVALGRWADVMLLAPLSCNSLAKMANGICDNLLMAVYLSATCPVIVAPAMDEDMWHHPSTKNNLNRIQSFGNTIIPVESGELASGLFGEGRMAEPEFIISFLEKDFNTPKLLSNKKVLVTAGPTYEAIDPVRYIGNYSSGKMGYAIAESFYNCGADVTLISGPTNLSIHQNIKKINITSSEEMLHQVMLQQQQADIIIMCAAVADYKPSIVASNKIKKNNTNWSLDLEKTTDILFELGKIKATHQTLIGFALETNNELDNAKEKLKNKNLDAIILNKFNQNNPVFGSDENEITIIESSNATHRFGPKTKKALAQDIVQFIISNKLHEEV
ncbi:MAG: bifunctional phosphopantothenoylcysteine decarboxylase/phosphopantothenate--cysteine ligase CoaBC [Chitinophagaceae bacterium]|nr:bifunctional phosphopantothenoylcysteine decarboxylase/phosphopantothenate--cysteine ligase CoaBC [Chitinophagaceae bacterium]